MSRETRPLSVLIAALGGEGGGVLANWVVTLAARQGWPVQSTSIPGVAQRTGATTYYVEILPREGAGDASDPIMALAPFPGQVDVMLASELIEVGRALQNGYVTPDRTTLIGSTHRIYAMQEKTSMADGRYPGDRVLQAARQMAKRPCLFDMEAATRESGSVISAVMFGALAGSQALPVSRASFEAVIRDAGIAVETNLAGFELGFQGAARALEAPAEIPSSPVRAGRPARSTAGALLEGVQQTYPAAVQDVVKEGVLRLIDYQGPRYAEHYLQRLEPIAALDRAGGGEARGWALTRETARQLALRMSFEDIVRVADLKTRRTRLERVRSEVRAEPDQPVVVREYLKPGVEEVCALLPAGLGRRVLRWAHARGLEDRLNLGMRLKSTSVTGFTALWLLARLRFWRPRSWRYRDEQAQMDGWLDAVHRAAALDYEFGLEVTELAGLIKGYGSTYRRGRANFETIMSQVVQPALEADRPARERLAHARQAALADPDGESLSRALAEVEPPEAVSRPAPRSSEASAPTVAARRDSAALEP